LGDLKQLLTGNRRSCSTRPKRWIARRSTFLELVKGKFVLTLQFVPFKGYACRSVRLRQGDPTKRLVTFPFPEFSVKKVKLGQGASATTATHLAAVESNVFAKLMNLVSHCAVVRYEDGDPRVPGWFTVKARGAAWIVQVKDPDSACQLQATGNTLDDALALADLLLGSEEAPWENDPFLKRTNTRNKKGS
jgi:hypothetical protein